MEHETKTYLDEVAEIAQANVNYHYSGRGDEKGLDSVGSSLLMREYLNLYQTYFHTEREVEAPAPTTLFAVQACCTMRHKLQQRSPYLWSDHDHGLYKLMQALMFLFKELYVVVN